MTDRSEQYRFKNRVLLAVLLFLISLFYVITLMRLGLFS
jgi:hypothetical protein